MKVNVFWFRRDLRLVDNHGLYQALNADLPVLPIFIFDKSILDDLPKNDARVTFIYDSLKEINDELRRIGSSLFIVNNDPLAAWNMLLSEFEINTVYANHDYEPYAIKRDDDVRKLLKSNSIEFKTFKDQVIFEKSDIIKADGLPYTIYTPFKNKWLERFSKERDRASFDSEKLLCNCLKRVHKLPNLVDIGFERSNISVSPFKREFVEHYDKTRDIPGLDKTTRLGTHLRFGTISVREVVRFAFRQNQIYLSELIWREFFMTILYHFPNVVHKSFKTKYDNIPWLNDESQFQSWCHGETGYPMVDAGMKELNQTGFMHNRVRMVVASFLCKHLLIDWRWGEAYFAEKLLDYELASNNGNWQWAAGTGCDAAPYFRVFNPTIQLKKFDPDLDYIKKWLPEFSQLGYPEPIVGHTFARNRAISTYKLALSE